MKIAIMGIRGIPANYGGFETFAEEMAPRLVQRGHEVTVYGRSNIIDYKDEYYKGVRIKILPTISHKYFDTVIHTLVCVVASFFSKYDVVLICNSANAVFSIIPRLAGKKVILNVDGLEWKRSKWNWLGQAFYRVSEMIATIFPTTIVTDARSIQEYYDKKFNKNSTYIPYGAPDKKITSTDILKKYNLNTRKYVLYVSRLEPENNALLLVKAFEKVKTDLKLVVVGDAPYSSEYIKALRKTKDSRILFTGYVFGKAYRELQSNAYCYVQATEVGGTHPALLEGMGFGNCILATDVPEHREVLGDTGIFFKNSTEDDLRNQLQFIVDNPEVAAHYRTKVVDRAQRYYSWDKVTAGYEKLFKTVARHN